MFLNTPRIPAARSAPPPPACFSRLAPELKTAIAVALADDRDIVNLSLVDRHTHGALAYLVSTIQLGREIPLLASTDDFKQMLGGIQEKHPRWRKRFMTLLFEHLPHTDKKMLPETFALLMHDMQPRPPCGSDSAHHRRLLLLLGRAFVQIPYLDRKPLATEFMALLRLNEFTYPSKEEFPHIQENYEAVTAALSGLAPGAQKAWAERMPIPAFPATPRAEKAGAMADLLKTTNHLHVAARQIQLDKLDWAVYSLPEKDRSHIRELLQQDRPEHA